MPVALLLSVQEEKPAFEAAMKARITDIGGDAGDGLEYSDFFRGGYGASLQVSWIVSPETSSVGLWASLGFDRFGGDGFSDDVGDRVRADPLDRYLALAGARARLLFDEPVFHGNPIFLDLRAGGGTAYHQDVEGAFRVGGVTLKGVEIFDAGFQAAAEVALSAGVASRSFQFGFGLGLRWIGGPDRGSGASTIVDPERWMDVSFEVGWEYRF